jgi:NADH:ubiquinone oxidoreductase subunit 6 (subunit J)
MIIWIFIAIILSGALTAVFANSLRISALALWAASLGVGGIYITVGAEELAIVQWIVSTLVAISFVFFAAMFGERERFETGSRPEIARLLLAGLVGAAFVAVVYLGWERIPTGSFALPASGNDLKAIGRALTERHLLSLELLAVTLFVVLIGGGVIARPESADSDSEPAPESIGGPDAC